MEKKKFSYVLTIAYFMGSAFFGFMLAIYLIMAGYMHVPVIQPEKPNTPKQESRLIEKHQEIEKAFNKGIAKLEEKFFEFSDKYLIAKLETPSSDIVSEGVLLEATGNDFDFLSSSVFSEDEVYMEPSFLMDRNHR